MASVDDDGTDQLGQPTRCCAAAHLDVPSPCEGDQQAVRIVFGTAEPPTREPRHRLRGLRLASGRTAAAIHSTSFPSVAASHMSVRDAAVRLAREGHAAAFDVCDSTSGVL
jgi:hypothetical protein